MNPQARLESSPTSPLVHGEIRPEWRRVLSAEALAFVASLAAEFQPLRKVLLRARSQRQAHFDAGHQPEFLTETAALRSANWKVAPLPPDLLNRQVVGRDSLGAARPAPCGLTAVVGDGEVVLLLAVAAREHLDVGGVVAVVISPVSAKGQALLSSATPLSTESTNSQTPPVLSASPSFR